MNQANPQRTYALVVGIEEYKAGSSWSLDGPASDALKFAKWLSDKYVPNENIFLFISELDDNQSKVNSCSINTQKATRENIYQTITETIPSYGEKGDLLYIYWSGHGTTNQRKDRRLFYDDGKQNLNLESFLESLGSDIFGNFDRQILLIDACANYYSKKISKSLCKEKYSVGKPIKSRQQVILLATKEGYKTKNIDKEKIGLFSKVLLGELKNESQLILPEGIPKIVENVKAIFKEQYYNQPTPIYLAYGNEDDIKLPSFALNQAAHKSLLLEERWKKLESILAEIDRYILYISCYFVLSKYKDDVIGNYEELEGLKLITTEPEEIINILNNIFLKTTHINEDERTEQLCIVLEFICYLFMLINNNEHKKQIRSWVQKTQTELIKKNIAIKVDKIKKQWGQHIQKNIRQQYNRHEPYLMIVLEPIKTKSNKFNFTSELVFQKNNNEPDLILPLLKNTEYSLDEDEKIDKDDLDYLILLSKKIMQICGLGEEKLIIEIFLPNNQIIKEQEKIQIKIDIYDHRQDIGCKYKFVLRSFERLTNFDYCPLENIKQKWDRLKTCNLNNFQWIYCPDDLMALDEFQSYSELVGINLLSYPENIKQKDVIDKLLQEVITKALPLFIWNSGFCNTKDQLKQEFAQILVCENLKCSNQLFESIKKIRNEASVDSLGYYLGFLCDNPYRLPSQYSTIAGDILVDFGF